MNNSVNFTQRVKAFPRIVTLPDDESTKLPRPGSKSRNETFYQEPTINVIGSGRRA